MNYREFVSLRPIVLAQYLFCVGRTGPSVVPTYLVHTYESYTLNTPGSYHLKTRYSGDIDNELPLAAT